MAGETPRSIRASIYIDGRPAVGTLRDLEQNVQRLRRELRALIPGTEEFNQKMTQLQAGERQLQRIRNEVNGLSGAFGFLKTEIGKLGVLATGFLGFQFVTSQFQNIISANAKLSDSLADIRKTTGMSEISVRRLQSQFKELNTRSSREELNSLAVIAGKLGISGERDLMGFVRAADQINVALGKDLGNAEAAINDLGKLTEIFHIKDAYGLEQALLKTGSAINGLGAAGTANEGYIVEFTKRLGGVAPQANITIQDVMALGAVMDELGQPVEAAATAVSQFVVGLGQDTAKFAKIAGMSKKAFEDLLSRDGMAAMKAVLTNLKSTGQGVQGLADSMGMVGEDGARATAALGLLTNNLELLNVRQKQTVDFFAAGTSITDEYNVKNSNFAATLDRLGKKFGALTSNASLTDFLTSGVKALDSFMTGLNKCMGFITGMIKMLTLGGVAWLTYSTYVAIAKSQTLAFMVNLIAGDAVMKTSRITTIALAGAKALLSRDLAKATQAMRLFSIATEANPIGALVAAIMAAVTAFAIYGDSVTTAVRIENSIIDVNAQAEKSYRQEKTALESAMATLQKRTRSKQDEAAAIAKLREMMPDHLKGYTDEEIAAGKATEAINKQIDAIMRKARASAASKRIEDLESENIEIGAKAKKGWNGLSDWEKMTTGLAMTAKHGALTNDGVKAAWFKELRQKELDNQQEVRELLGIYGKDINYVSAITPNLNAGGSGAGTFNLKEATQAQLQEQLQNDTKALAQLKQGTAEYNKVAAEMLAIRKRLKEIAKDTGVGGSNSEENAIKKAAAAYKELQKQVGSLKNDTLKEGMAKNELELKNTADKYDKLIAKEREFLSMKGATGPQKKQTTQNINDLKEQKAVALGKVRVKQEQEADQKIKELRAALGNVYETELDKETNRINKFYDELQADAADYAAFMILEEQRAKDLADAKIREEQRFQDAVDEIKQQGIVLNASADKLEIAQINKKYDDQIEALKKKFGIEKTLTKQQQAAIDAINANRKKEIDTSEKQTAKEKRDQMLESAQTVANAVFEIGRNNRQAETDAQLKALDDRKEKELSNKNLTEEQRKAIEEKYDKQAAAIKLKAWQADKEASLQSAIINGALAVVKALPNIPLSIAAGVAAAAQIAVIASTKPPQFAEGGFSDNDPAGYVNQATVFRNSASGRPFMAGEAGREWIAPNWMLQNPRTANLIGMLEVARKEKRAFAAGGFNISSTAGSQTASAPDMAMQTDLLAKQIMLLSDMNKQFSAFAQKPWEFPMRAYQQKEQDIEDIRNKANS